jgi:anaerobic ribonucleoside-triphosphate reductase
MLYIRQIRRTTMENKFMELYNELEKEEKSYGFCELEEFLEKFTQELSSEEAWSLVLKLMSPEELKEYLDKEEL